MERMKIAKRINTAFLILIITAVMVNIGLMQSYGASSKPATPKISYLRSTTANSFTIKSKRNSEVTGYQIKYSLTQDFKNSKYITVKGKELSKKVKKLKGGKRYYVRIRAYKIKEGEKTYSGWSSRESIPVTKSGKSAMQSKPATPKISYLRSTTANSFTIKSKWNSKVTGYQIKYSLTQDFKKSKYITVKGKKLSKKVKKLKGGKKYYVRIRAYKIKKGKKIYSGWSSRKSVPVIKNEKSAIRYTTGITTQVYRRANANSPKIKLWYGTKIKVTNSKTLTNGTWYTVNYKGKKYYLWDKTKNPQKITGKQPVKSDKEYLAKCKTPLQKELLTNAFDMYHNWRTAYDHGSVFVDGLEMDGDKYIFHCSSFVSYVYNSTLQKHAPPFKLTNKADSIPRTKYLLNEGLTGEIKTKTVCSGTPKLSSLRPGDILCFKMMSDNPNEYDHMSIYIGNGQMIQCTRVIEGKYCNRGLDPDGGICIAPLSGMYKARFKKAIRILPDRIRKANLKKTVNEDALNVMTGRNCRKVAEKNALHSGDTVIILFTFRTVDGNHNAYIAYGDNYKKTGYIKNYKKKLK